MRSDLAARHRFSPQRLKRLSVASVIVVTLAQVPQTSAVAGTGSSLNYAATVGLSDVSEPSGMAPPLASALNGYAQSYVTDFTGSELPAGWSKFNGVPGGDPGTHFKPSQVSVANGVLQLTAAYSPSTKEWITGGTCLCTLPRTYGAYLVRSRVTGPGPTVVELLWPANNSWPPEIDFNETSGGITSTMATVHYQSSNQTDYRIAHIDMTKWHTWGVVWSPLSITYLVDGRVWGVVRYAGEIPRIPMTLDIQQQTWCSQGSACPASSQSTLVDWATEYVPTSLTSNSRRPSLVTIPISARISSTTLSSVLEVAATTVYRRHARTVIVTGTRLVAPRQSHVSSAVRLQSVISILEKDLHSLGSSPRIIIHWSRVLRASRAAPDLLLTLEP